MAREIPTLDEIRALIPEDMHERAVIAGSFAIAPETARDVDVWVLRGRIAGHALLLSGYSTLEADASRITDHLAGVEGIQDDLHDYDELRNHDVLLVAGGRLQRTGYPFHILCAGWYDADGLIGSFDLSVHAWWQSLNPAALSTPSGLANGQSTHPNQPIALLQAIDELPAPLDTLVRIARFSRRYGTQYPWHILQQLLAAAQLVAQRATYAQNSEQPASPAEDAAIEPLDDSEIPF